jgi:LysM repeat protein
MAALFLIVLFFLPEKTASADNSIGTYTISSIQIEEGDTLWSIAKEHYSEEFSSLTSFISEIKRMNGLTSDTVYAGSYILVPQYVLY